MKTYPIVDEDGSLRGFEISSCPFFGPLMRVLRSIPGVSGVRRQWFNDHPVAFAFCGAPAVVAKPLFGQSRYWLGLERPDAHPSIDITPLHEAFQNTGRLALIPFMG